MNELFGGVLLPKHPEHSSLQANFKLNTPIAPLFIFSFIFAALLPLSRIGTTPPIASA